MLVQRIAFLAAAVPSAFAFVQITSPAAGESYEGGKSIRIAWKDSGDDPPISELDSYSLYLQAGGSTPGTFQQIGPPLAVKSAFPLGNSINGSVPIDAGASIENAYFFQMISTPIDGGTITTYSLRFSLTSMTGTFAPAIERAARQVKNTHSLETQNNIVRREAQGVVPAAPAGAAAASYSVPYQSQDGATKYAPMQKHPGTTITAKQASMQYPSSAYTPFKTYMPPPKQKTTQTLANTYSTQSQENSASQAAMPDDAMQKYLARWKD